MPHTSDTFHFSTGSIYSCAPAKGAKNITIMAKINVFFILLRLNFQVQKYSYFGTWANFFFGVQKI